MKNYKPIKKQQLAGYLMQRGFVLRGIEANLDNSGRNVSLFNDSERLQEAIENYFKTRCNKIAV